MMLKFRDGVYMKVWLAIITGFWASAGLADSLISHEIPMESQGARTFYVQSTIHGYGESMMLVDTGSGHSVINEETLAGLKSSGDAEFLKNLQAVMADGSSRIVPLYRISSITLGGGCVIRDVEAAILPNNARQILGISALQKAAPFGLSFDPPTLSLSNCELPGVQTANEEVVLPTDVLPAKVDQKTPVETQELAAAS